MIFQTHQLPYLLHKILLLPLIFNIFYISVKIRLLLANRFCNHVHEKYSNKKHGKLIQVCFSIENSQITIKKNVGKVWFEATVSHVLGSNLSIRNLFPFNRQGVGTQASYDIQICLFNDLPDPAPVLVYEHGPVCCCVHDKL